MQYGVRWEVLAAINEIETDYGRNLNVSYAGALGWMQFMPATWKMYGVDANRDGEKDPYNPVDAIFAAARYLRAAGADKDLRRAIFAYNHADWYVDSVLLRARVIGGLPSDLVGSLTGLTQGRFPVHAKATYAGSLKKADRKRKIREGANAAVVVESDEHRQGIDIFARKGAPAIAVNDGRIISIGKSKRLGRYVKLLDVYGNTYTYGQLGKVAKTYPAPKKRVAKRSEIRRELDLDKTPKPKKAASATTAPARKRAVKRVVAPKKAPAPAKERLSARGTAAPAPAAAKERLFAHPERPNARVSGGSAQLGEPATPAEIAPIGFDKRDFVTKPLREGARVIGGTVLGRIAKGSPETASHMLFEIRPAGRGAPRVDPKPILDGWKLLESTAIYRAAKKNPFVGEDARNPSIGQILLMSKDTLIQRVISNPRIQIYGCGKADIRSGQIDRRVLATLEYLASSGLQADRQLAALRPRADDVLRQRLRALHRHRDGHRRDQRRLDHGPPGRRLDRRHHDPAPPDAPGHDEAPPDHLPDDLRRRRQHLRDGRPRGPHPRRLAPAVRPERQGRPPHRRDPQAQAVDQAHRPPRRHRQPRGARGALQVLAEGHQERVARPPGRVVLSALPAHYRHIGGSAKDARHAASGRCRRPPRRQGPRPAGAAGPPCLPGGAAPEGRLHARQPAPRAGPAAPPARPAAARDGPAPA